jgi:hypothetical protein
MPAAPEHPFRCADCRAPLGWDPAEAGRVLICGNPQCPAAGMALTVAAAQRRRIQAGEDRPAPGAGWPRPRRDGLPVPYVVPISDGRPWWRLTDNQRILTCQARWRCQLCGLPLPERAWVVLDNEGHIESDTALHHRCLTLALTLCPHLRHTRRRYTEILRAQVHAEDLDLTRYGWRQRWSVPAPTRPR